MRMLIMLFILCLSWWSSPVLAGEPFYGTVKRILDGDSLVIKSGRDSIEIRLYGVDCPEFDQAFSNEAKSFVRKMVYGKTVLVQPLYNDSYKRTVAIVASVASEDETVNGELVRAGLAWVYPRYCRKKVCTTWKEMELSAKKSKKGIWSDAQPISPWVWKRAKYRP